MSCDLVSLIARSSPKSNCNSATNWFDRFAHGIACAVRRCLSSFLASHASKIFFPFVTRCALDLAVYRWARIPRPTLSTWVSCCQVRNTTCRRIDGIIATAVGTWRASLKLLQTARSCGKHQENFLYPYGGWGRRCLKTALNTAALDWMKTTGMLNRTTTSIVDAWCSHT